MQPWGTGQTVQLTSSPSLSFRSLLVLSTLWNATLPNPTLAVPASTTATGATTIALPAATPHPSPRHAPRTLSPITTPASKRPSLREAMTSPRVQAQTIQWSPLRPPRPCAIYAIPSQMSYTSTDPASHHLPSPLPHLSIPVQSMVHAHALSRSPPSYLLSPGLTPNAIASSAHVVDHHLPQFFYELPAVAAAIMIFHRVRHTSHAAGMMAVRRPHSRPSGFIGSSCFASSVSFVMTGRISGIMLRRGRLMNCITGTLRSVRGGNKRGRE
jgi:hypothetical protein